MIKKCLEQYTTLAHCCKTLINLSITLVFATYKLNILKVYCDVCYLQICFKLISVNTFTSYAHPLIQHIICYLTCVRKKRIHEWCLKLANNLPRFQWKTVAAMNIVIKFWAKNLPRKQFPYVRKVFAYNNKRPQKHLTSLLELTVRVTFIDRKSVV
jgi:hypothetical protein